MPNGIPMLFQWDGEAMRPVGPRYQAEADKAFVIGERYRLAEIEERSDATHKHHFAWLREAWAQLPERIADQFPTPEHLRKRGLIDAGFYNEMLVDAGSNAAAIRVANSFRAHDEFVVCVVRGPIVAVRTAKSQSRRAMDRKTFQDSKTKLMEIVASLIGVSPEELAKNASEAA